MRAPIVPASSSNLHSCGRRARLQTKMNDSLRTLTLLPLAAAVSSVFAAPADDAKWNTLETSVVSATGYEQDVRRAPASMSVTTAEELATKPVTDIGSAIGDVPGVDIGLTKMGNSTISIRGFDSDYTLIMVDGRRQNVSGAMMDNGFNPTSVFMPPPGMIERIEVLRGPASLVWGSDAVGGVVNVITKKHPNEFTGSFTIEGLFQEHDEWANRGGTSFYLGVPVVKDVVSLGLRGRYNAWGKTEVMTPAGKLATHSPTEGYNENVGARLTVTPDTANTWWLDGDFTRFKGGSMNTSNQSIQSRQWYHKYNVAAGHEGEYDFGRTESFVQWNRLDKVKGISTPNDPTKSSYSETHGTFNDPLASSENFELSAKLTTPLELGSLGSMVLTTGGDAIYETFVNNQSTASVIEGVTLDQTQLAAFAEGEWFMNDQWSATVGGRVMWSDIFGAHATPRAYLVWQPMQALSFKGGVAAGYKTPEVRKLVDGLYNSSKGTDYYGNPDLKPEESWSYELSSTAELGGVASVTVGGFFTQFKNMLDSEEIAESTYKAINHGRVESKGVEVLVKTRPVWNTRFTGGYTFTHAEITEGADEGKRPNKLPRHTLTARVDWASGPFTAYVKSSSKFDMAVSNPGNKGSRNAPKYEDYTIVDIGGSWTPVKNHVIAWAVNNVLDKDTAVFEKSGTSSWANIYSNYIEGRNLWLSYTYSF